MLEKRLLTQFWTAIQLQNKKFRNVEDLLQNGLNII